MHAGTEKRAKHPHKRKASASFCAPWMDLRPCFALAVLAFSEVMAWRRSPPSGRPAGQRPQRAHCLPAPCAFPTSPPNFAGSMRRKAARFCDLRQCRSVPQLDARRGASFAEVCARAKPAGLMLRPSNPSEFLSSVRGTKNESKKACPQRPSLTN